MNAPSPILSGSPLTLPGCDPVFPALERFRAAHAAYVEAVDLEADAIDNRDDYEHDPGASAALAEMMRRTHALAAESNDALRALVATTPTTLPGALALAAFVSGELDPDCYPDPSRAVLATVAAAVLRLALQG